MVKRFCIILFLSLIWTSPCLAQTLYIVDKKQSHIKGSVSYTVIGRYRAQFNDIGGKINFDPNHLAQSSVVLTVKTKSLHSRYPKLDRIILSKRLLDAAAYPTMTFESQSITKKPSGYWVIGTAHLHGISKSLAFPFDVKGPFKDVHQRSYIKASGRWVVNRKDFDVVWNKILDQGGLIVGNHITIDWDIVAWAKN